MSEKNLWDLICKPYIEDEQKEAWLKNE